MKRETAFFICSEFIVYLEERTIYSHQCHLQHAHWAMRSTEKEMGYVHEGLTEILPKKSFRIKRANLWLSTQSFRLRSAPCRFRVDQRAHRLYRLAPSFQFININLGSRPFWCHSWWNLVQEIAFNQSDPTSEKEIRTTTLSSEHTKRLQGRSTAVTH